MDNEIKDFGKKIGGAKKDLWKTRGLQIEDLTDMNIAERDKYITKNNIWKTPDYQKLVDDGLSVRVAYFIKTIKDSAPTKPVITYADNTPEAIKEKQEGYIAFMTYLRDKTMAIKTDKDILDFYKDVIKPYTIPNGRYVKISEDAYDCIDNKLLKAAQVSSFIKIDDDIRKKQFCYSEEDKILSEYNILHYKKENVDFEKDYRDRTVMSIKVFNGKIYVYPKHEYENPENWFDNTYFVMRKGEIINFNFNSREDVKDFILNEEEKGRLEKGPIKTTTTRKKAFVPILLDSLQYTGPDYREGKDITGKDYLEVFNFKGGEFGNWLSQDDRQSNLNHAYNAFSVLADSLNIDKKDISLNNNLSIAFGSRGNSSAMAHYEPLREVINLTKMKGAGSLAHEWGHALDDILNKSITGKSLNDRRVSELLEEHKDLLNKLKYKEVEVSDTEKDIKLNKLERNIRAYIDKLVPANNRLTEEQKDMKEKLIQNILNDKGDKGISYEYGGKVESIEALSSFKKSITNKKIPLNDCKRLSYYIRALINEREYQSVKTVKRVETEFYKNSQIFDKVYSKQKEGYWASNNEMFARAFACYIKDKASELGLRCDYLTGHSDSAITKYEDKIIKAFPTGEERKIINQAFDILIDKYKELNLLHKKEIEVPERKTLDSVLKNAYSKAGAVQKEQPTPNKDLEK